ncbi:MAG: RagB/SusD family nutrient uptake outer membrane protein [Bacteroidales bacterium]
MKKSIIFLIAIIGIFILSCDDDFLERRPLDRLNEAAVFNDPVLLEFYVNEQYRSIGYGHARHWESKLTDESYGDENLHFQVGTLTPENIKSYRYNNDPVFFALVDYWEMAYVYLRNMNLFLEKTGDSDIDKKILDRLTGEIYFLRAFTYFKLLSHYGGVPIIKVPVTSFDATFKRNTIDETVAFILSDIGEALKRLPDNHFSGVVGYGRANKAAAFALKSRLMLYAASPLYKDPDFTFNSPSTYTWAQARDAAKEAIDSLESYGYALHNNYEGIFQGYNNKEGIFPKVFLPTAFEGHRVTHYHAPFGYGGYGGWGGKNCPTLNIVDDFEMTNGESPFIYVNGEKQINPASGYSWDLDSTNPYLNRDPRLQMAILTNGDVFRGRPYEPWVHENKDSVDGRDGRESPISTKIHDATSTGMNIRKYMETKGTELLTGEHRFDEPWWHFRMAELYLNYAEALFESGGDENVARQYVNNIRNRTGVEMPPIDDSGNELRERIRKERRIELCYEGYRMWDLRRWKTAMEVENTPLEGFEVRKMSDGTFRYKRYNVLNRSFLQQHYWIPIPYDEIVKNNGDLKQSPYYD